jgi:amino acid transporter
MASEPSNPEARTAAGGAVSGAPAERVDRPHEGGGRDLIRWGPIVAGLLVTLTTLVVLAALGLAIGLSAFEPGDVGAADTAATIYGIASAIVAFLLGGFVAGRGAARTGHGNGAFQGLMVGVTAIAVTVFLVGIGAGNLLGAAASDLRAITEVATNFEIDSQQAERAARAAYEDAEAGAWGTVIGLLVALAAAALGGLFGGNRRQAAARSA